MDFGLYVQRLYETSCITGLSVPSPASGEGGTVQADGVYRLVEAAHGKLAGQPDAGDKRRRRQVRAPQPLLDSEIHGMV